ncbi:MAG: hypothetical protein ABIC57_01865 [bacterium]
MKVKNQGIILELDHSKEYILIVKAGSMLGKEVKKGHIEMKNGRIFFVGTMNEFIFVENSDKITDIKLKE